jgi:hypothetical protein
MSVNYYSLFLEYDKYFESPGYYDYKELVNFYYKDKNLCPNCKNTGSLKRSVKDRKLVIECNKCIWYANMQHPVSVNLYSILAKYKSDNKKYTFQIKDILEHKDITKETTSDFNRYKSKYKQSLTNINSINKIFTIQNDNIYALNNRKYELYSKLHRLGNKRKDRYIPIDTKEKKEIKEYLIKNGMPTKSELEKIIKTTKVQVGEIKDMFKWLDYVRRYVLNQKKLEEINSELKRLKANYIKMNSNFVTKKHVMNTANIKNIKINPTRRKEAQMLELKRTMLVTDNNDSDDEEQSPTKTKVVRDIDLDKNDITVVNRKINLNKEDQEVKQNDRLKTVILTKSLEDSHVIKKDKTNTKLEVDTSNNNTKLEVDTSNNTNLEDTTNTNLEDTSNNTNLEDTSNTNLEDTSNNTNLEENKTKAKINLEENKTNTTLIKVKRKKPKRKIIKVKRKKPKRNIIKVKRKVITKKK